MYRSLPFAFASKTNKQSIFIPSPRCSAQRPIQPNRSHFQKEFQSTTHTHTHTHTQKHYKHSIHPIRACALLPSDAGSHVGSLLLNTGDFSIAEWFLHHPGAPHKHTNTHNGYECISQHRETQRTYRSRRTGHYVAGSRALTHRSRRLGSA